MSKCYIMRSLVKIKLLIQEIVSIISLFLSKLRVFLSAVTLKIRSRSQSPNQGFSMSMCCFHANFGQYPVVRSGYIVHILMIHTNISDETDADGIRITVYASHSNLFVGYINCPIVYFPFEAQIQGKKMQHI